VPVAAAQGTADALVVKIPGANIPSTVTLSTPGGSGVPGQIVAIPVDLTLAGTTAPASFQIDLIFDPTKLIFLSASAGAQLTGAGGGLSSSEVTSGDVRLTTTGTSQNALSGGVVASASFTMASSFGSAATPMALVNCMSADALGNPLSTGCTAGTIGVTPGGAVPSTVTLSTSGGNGVPGQTVTIPVNLTLGGATAPSSFQIDLIFDPTKLTFVSASASTQLTGAGGGLSSSEVSSGDVRLTTTGTSQNALSIGVVAYASFTMASSFGSFATPMALVNCTSADGLGNLLSTGCSAGTVGVLTCDVNGAGTVGVADVQTMVNEALGFAPAVNDLNQDGVVNVADIQLVIDAALGNACVLR